MLNKEVNFPLVSLLSLATESVHAKQNLSCASHQFHRSILFSVENGHYHGDMPQETGGISSSAFPRGKYTVLASCKPFVCFCVKIFWSIIHCSWQLFLYLSIVCSLSSKLDFINPFFLHLLNCPASACKCPCSRHLNFHHIHDFPVVIVWPNTNPSPILLEMGMSLT